jgi:hypothetical protein
LVGEFEESKETAKPTKSRLPQQPITPTAAGLLSLSAVPTRWIQSKTPEGEDCIIMSDLLGLWTFSLALLTGTASNAIQLDHLASLLECKTSPNPHTQHLRIPNIAQNISQTPGVQHFNPTIVALPYWAENQYLVVSRVVTEGFHQESVLCEAKICVKRGDGNRHENEKDCTADSGLEETGGLYCVTAPVVVNIPATPAEQCDGPWSPFPDIPGFHDPRIFWSGKGEPLIIVNSASQYACLGLWITDLRTVYEPLKKILSSQPGHPSSEPPVSYPQLTELTRNPASTRAAVEKNWFLFFPTPATTYIHYDLSSPPLPIPSKRIIQEVPHDHAIPVRREEPTPDNLPSSNKANTTHRPSSSYGRTFAKLLPHGHGHTTGNLTSPLEQPCLTSSPDPLGQPGHWHQATNALKLILCRRHASETCDHSQSVHFAVMHRKFSNIWDLPLRYERYFVVWDARPPFALRAMSKYPVMVSNETASGWTAEENWALEAEKERLEREDRGHALVIRSDEIDFSMMNDPFYPITNITNITRGRNEEMWLHKDRFDGHRWDNWAYFTYTPSIAWAWRPQFAFEEGEGVLESLNVGYLDDEVILGIGIDDTEQAFARAKAETLLQCLRACPAMREESASGDEDGDMKRTIMEFQRQDEMMRQDTENRDFFDV